MKPIFKKMEYGKLFFELDKNIYHKKAIIAETYRFAGDCYISVNSISDVSLGVYFTPKEGCTALLEKIGLEFCNELIDQQLRLDTESCYGHIRDLIVEHAFSPIDDIPHRIKKQK